LLIGLIDGFGLQNYKKSHNRPCAIDKYFVPLQKFSTAHMKHFVYWLAAAMVITACHSKKEDEKPLDAETVLVYIAGDNNLNDFVAGDMREMIRGSKELAEGCNLLLFVDRQGKRPYFMKVEQGDTMTIERESEELRTSDPATLSMAMKWAMKNYAARSYGLVLWGHADGWIVKDNTANSRNRAYGQDTDGGENLQGTWMNITDMARALEALPCPEGSEKPLRFIFADCCCFQSVESAYELRNCTDYIIASAAEIPGDGAPYHTVIPTLFNQRDDFYQETVNAYYAQQVDGYKEPLSVVRTSYMEALAQATATALQQSLKPLEEGYPDVEGLIYYYSHSLFDMNDFLLRYASSDAYEQWKRVFDEAVVYKKMAMVWLANYVSYQDIFTQQIFRDFEVTEERYGGISMFVPQNPDSLLYRYQENARRQNQHISDMQWYHAAALDRLGW
jgi:hypothetical protein